MLQVKQAIKEIPAKALPKLEALQHCAAPLVIRGLVDNWPLVIEARQSSVAAASYVRQFCQHKPVQAFFAPSDTQGRFFYSEQLDGFNFTQQQTTLEQVLERILSQTDTEHKTACYMGSTTLDYCAPGMSQYHSLPLTLPQPLVSLWVGSETKVVAHYDVPDNIACVASGRRRFTLFPPGQTANLYPGPFEFTPAGQPVSMVNFDSPDLKRFPCFAQAVAQAQYAELDAGDAIYIPSMWWHQVDSLSDLNILINYWWRQTPAYCGLPTDALLHAMLSIRDLPPVQRKIWQQQFEHYVFNVNDDTAAHLPADKRGILGPMLEQTARKLRAMLLSRLNR